MEDVVSSLFLRTAVATANWSLFESLRVSWDFDYELAAGVESP